jgi:antitoxin (DNA-binding transcriptional repressor) of toxin-antitoxin stability system
MYPIDLKKAKLQLDNLIQIALNGEEVIITENDAPILKLVRIPSTAEAEPNFLHKKEQQPPPAKQYRQSGSAKGLIFMTDDFDEPLDDFNEYMQ